MAFIATSLALDTSPINAIIPNTNALVVYSCLASHADSFKGKCWPSINRIATICKLSERAVQRSLNELEKVGLVVRKFRLGQSTVYHLPLHTDCASPPPDDLPPPPPSAGRPEPVIESIKELPRARAAKSVPAPTPKSFDKPVEFVVDDVPKELMADWQAVRQSKGHKVLTFTAMQALRAEAIKAGISTAEAVRECVLAGWARFQAHWLKPRPTETLAVAVAPVRPPEPEVVIQPVSPEVLAARRESIEKLKRDIKAAAAEKPDPKANARVVIARKTAGEHVSRAALDFACFVLGIKSWKDAAKCAT